MSIPDAELAAWRAAWTADAAPLTNARRIAARGRARMIRRHVLEAIVGVLWLAAATTLAIVRPRPSVIVLAGGIIVFVIAAWAFSIWNQAGAWRPLGESVRDFLDLGIERRRRDLRAVRVSFWGSIVELVLLLAWVAWGGDPGIFPASMRGTAAWLIPPVAAPIAVWIWLYVWRRRALAELRTLEHMLRSLDV